jgi:hypothetical protein
MKIKSLKTKNENKNKVYFPSLLLLKIKKYNHLNEYCDFLLIAMKVRNTYFTNFPLALNISIKNSQRLPHSRSAASGSSREFFKKNVIFYFRQ